MDVGIIAGALPYLEATSGLNAGQLSFIVAAVLLGSVISTLFAGLLADWMGRKKMMSFSGMLFVISIPMIALAHGYGPLVFGRLLQGISAGLIGVVVPLYLAECLGAANRGKGTGIFQWLLTLGIVAAADHRFVFQPSRGRQSPNSATRDKLFAFKDTAWRSIFWVSLPPGILFVIGSFMVAESPRWLFRRGKKDAARAALLRSRTDEQAEIELKEMEETVAAENAKSADGEQIKESLLRRKYVIPFVLACVILACNQATGVNSIIGYNATILIQAGLDDKQAHLGYVILTLVNFLMTIVAVVLVDRKGRKFLLSLGSAGVIVSLVCVGLACFTKPKNCAWIARTPCRQWSRRIKRSRWHSTKPPPTNLLAGKRLRRAGPTSVRSSFIPTAISARPPRSRVPTMRRPSRLKSPATIVFPANKVVAFFTNPFANLDAAQDRAAEN